MTVRFSMPFRAEFVPHILGTKWPTKTVTRRFSPRHVGTLLRAKIPDGKRVPSRWPGFANLIVVDCRSVHLRDMDDAEAHKEGLGSLSDFIRIWQDLYGGRPGKEWADNPSVWRIEFRMQPAKVK